jgi:hypothetical protein
MITPDAVRQLQTNIERQKDAMSEYYAKGADLKRRAQSTIVKLEAFTKARATRK